MNPLLTFLSIAIALPLGTLALFGFLTPREDAPEKFLTKPEPLRETDVRQPQRVKQAAPDNDARQPIEPATGPSAEAQATRQPAPTSALQVSVSQPMPQADWTPACDDAVSALVNLKIPKREATSLVRQSAGASVQEILSHALKIHGRGRGQALNGNANSTTT